MTQDGPVNNIMNSTEKLVIVVTDMWGKNTPWCHSLGALYLVADNECESSPEVEALKEHLRHMHGQVKDLCHSYDKLRSMVGAIELEQGVESPRFYADGQAGCVEKHNCPVLD